MISLNQTTFVHDKSEGMLNNENVVEGFMNKVLL